MSAARILLYSETGFENAKRPTLLSEARHGNREAFAQMVSPYVPALYRRARGLTGNSADAQDVSQEALLKAWSRLRQFSGKRDESTDDFRAWISRIAANSSIDLLRQRRDGKILSLDEPNGSSEETFGAGIATREHNPEELCARREMGRLLAQAIVQLPQDLRQACLLRDVLHYSTEEVAQRLRISTVAVRLRLFRAHRRLRERLEELLRPAPAPQKVAALRAQKAPTEKLPRFAALTTAASYASGD
jgi:RNA polymerase sigma-70 factor, ECF subfamily